MTRLARLIPILALLIAVTATAACAGTLFKSDHFTTRIVTGWEINKGDDLLNLTGPDGASSLLVNSDDATGVDLDTFEVVFLKQLQKSEKDFELVSKDRTEIDGVAAGVWTFTSSLDDGTKIKTRIYSAIKDDTAYNIIMVCLPEQFDSDAADLKSMLNSWTWL